MSAGTACKDKAEHRSTWRVLVRRANYSAFNGYHRTPSDYSQLWCPTCGGLWRTKAAYVDTVPDGHPCTRCTQTLAQTQCRICRKGFCSDCFTDHHHEGYGTPAG